MLDIERYERSKAMYIDTWELVKEMQIQENIRLKFIDEKKKYKAQYIIHKEDDEFVWSELQLFDTYYRKLVFVLRLSSTQDISIIYHTGISLYNADDYPKIFKLARHGDNASYMEYPFTEEQYFQRSTVQDVLPEEDYKFWDDLSKEQRTFLDSTGLENINAIRVLLYDGTLEPSTVNSILLPYLRNEI